MALSFYFKFCAPASKTPEDLELFFKKLEKEAQRLAFDPTLVVNAKFDTRERRDFARRLTTGLFLENESLKGVVLPSKEQIFSHDPVNGGCRIIPEQGVFLVVTNEQREEIVFGLLRYPEFLTDQNGKKIAATGAGKDWRFEDFVDSPDPRYRVLVKKIAEAGFLKEAVDEYSTGENPFNLPAN
jgi:hypothetical protein